MKKLSDQPDHLLIEQGLTSSQLEEIVNILVEHVNPASIILFGSFAKKKSRPDSDMDLAYIPDQQKPDAYERFRIAALIADKTGREVDLIDFEQASPVLRAQIIDSGLLLYEPDSLKRQLLFMRSLKEYAMLNEERREIIESRMREEPL
ncbi:hypothetical protein AWM70_12195 [Paenibacillus yonginensis]|uniref:Polymerase beta nucleotidyltransferase domain-containing protein n=1 Tax=Paenibacillus yonginensis TaxID=1462996 RepID=A0A1B1N1I1_9BACL|nr:nucleotidyltransferase domain-containing protein [Paenibacillus yonginensis]ANS75269.1 hypothetical protein AWM70_12195 [Paenibacillus yonginensis]